MKTRFQIYTVMILASAAYSFYREDTTGFMLSFLVLPFSVFAAMKSGEFDEKK